MKILILTILLIFLTSCQTAVEEEIKIGAVLPLTGIASFHAQNEKQGIDLAVKEINLAGGINGKQIKIIYEDDETNPGNTISAINKLVEVDKVDVIIGGTWDFLANAAMPVIDAQQVVLISPSALPDTVDVSTPYFYSTHSAVAINQKAVEEFIKESSAKTASIMIVNVPWGLAHLEMFKKAAENTGLEILDEIKLPEFDSNDLSTEITKFKDTKPDLLLINANFNDMALFGKKRVELNLQSEILAHSNFLSTIEAGNLDMETGKGVSIFRFDEPNKEFIKKFTEEYNQPPLIYSDTAYDTVYAIKYAMETGDLRQGLKEIEFDGASGHIFFGNNYYPENKQPVIEKI